MTTIAWTTSSWNPIRAVNRITGQVGWHCQKVSPGCTNCYAEAMNRYRGTGRKYDVRGAEDIHIGISPDALAIPLHWKKPRKVFVCSMTDLFLEQHTDEMIDQVFAVMALCGQHTFQVLTKRPERMRAYLTDSATPFRIARAMHERGRTDRIDWPFPNVWMGVSAEDQERADERIPILLDTPAAVRWVSYEPALGPIDFRPWLGYYPLHDTTETDRGDHLPRSFSRADRSEEGRVGLAGSAEAEEQVERGCDDKAGSPAQDRCSSGGRLPAGQDHDRRPSDDNPSTEARVALPSGADSAGVDDQSQERNQVGEQAGQPRTGNPCGTDAAHDRRSSEGPSAESIRDPERNGAVDGASGQGDSAEAFGGREATSNSEGLRRVGQDDFQNRSGGPLAISWVVCGGESGRGARPFDPAWIGNLLEQCRDAHVACFIKQMGSVIAKRDGYSDAKGEDPSEWPLDLRVREYPR